MRRWWPVLALLAIFVLVLISFGLITLVAENRQERFNQFIESLTQQGVIVTISSHMPNWIGGYKKYLPASIVDLLTIKETKVELTGDKVTKHTLACLAQFPNVTTLVFEDTSNIDDDSLALLSEIKSLELLILNGTRLSGEGIVHLQNLTNLRLIAFGKNELTEKGIEQLLSMKTDIRADEIKLESVKPLSLEVTDLHGSKSIKSGELLTIRASFASTHFVPKFIWVNAHRKIDSDQSEGFQSFPGTHSTYEKGVYQFTINSEKVMQKPGRYRVEVSFFVTELYDRLAIGMKLGEVEFEVK